MFICLLPILENEIDNDTFLTSNEEYVVRELFSNFNISSLRSTTWVNLLGSVYKPSFVVITQWNKQEQVFDILIIYTEKEIYYIWVNRNSILS